jgi:hypothetical protein
MLPPETLGYPKELSCELYEGLPLNPVLITSEPFQLIINLSGIPKVLIVKITLPTEPPKSIL